MDIARIRDQPGVAEIDHVRAICRHDDVPGRYIKMHDAAPMQRGKRLAHVGRQLNG